MPHTPLVYFPRTSIHLCHSLFMSRTSLTVSGTGDDTGTRPALVRVHRTVAWRRCVDTMHMFQPSCTTGYACTCINQVLYAPIPFLSSSPCAFPPTSPYVSHPPSPHTAGLFPTHSIDFLWRYVFILSPRESSSSLIDKEDAHIKLSFGFTGILTVDKLRL